MAGAVLAAGLAPVLQAQTYYKWKDASGATHYSDTPPPKGQASAVRVRAGEATAAVPDATPAPASSAEATGSSGESPELKAAEAKYRQEACTAAKGDVAAAQGGAMLLNGKDLTTARRLSADERAAALAAAQKRVQQSCGAGAEKP
ncbi:DUF4124 domain-containing protein [Dyella sp.]|jgi:hypothetical protein|uniref:DUF4124 domain-containing protein n=1 Tax=Dyella sp. TaxID=1869338 RepID=UPI002D79D591|nr:DUF4124 domain-containing protein [Dyella sp.]HET6433060.1 DUF4124 domain-containing protein [Dyella sp.]